MTKYLLTYKKYNIMKNDYDFIKEEIYTDDIFHYVGVMIYKTLEELKNIRWCELKEQKEDVED